MLNAQPVAAVGLPLRAAPKYSSDAYAYSTHGGFAKTADSTPRADNVHRLPSALRSASVNAADRSAVANTLLITDAACDLPAEWLAANKVAVLPIKIHVDDWHLIDLHDEYDTLEFFRKDIATKGMRAQSEPLSPLETRDFVQSNLRKEINSVIEVAIASSRSKIYMNSLAAAQNLMLMHGRVRRNMGIHEPFKMWVVDSETVFAGQGVLVAEAVRQLQAGMSAAKLAQHLDTLRHHVHTLVVPKDLFYLYSRAKIKGDNSVGWLTYNVGKMLDIKAVVHAYAGKTEPCMKVRGYDDAVKRVMDIAITKVREGLITPIVTVSYAGNIDDVRESASFVALESVCMRRGVTLHLSTMSMTGGLNVGAGALSIAFACQSLDV
ncbi:MAG: DegV family EDD domain-containing protein [Betaproteobacteria bacterium]|nr:MAG: DegV family EDD domain-containing protein [Betaproteobacteria bacterium]